MAKVNQRGAGNRFSRRMGLCDKTEGRVAIGRGRGKKSAPTPERTQAPERKGKKAPYPTEEFYMAKKHLKEWCMRLDTQKRKSGRRAIRTGNKNRYSTSSRPEGCDLRILKKEMGLPEQRVSQGSQIRGITRTQEATGKKKRKLFLGKKERSRLCEPLNHWKNCER